LQGEVPVLITVVVVLVVTARILLVGQAVVLLLSLHLPQHLELHTQ
jgi:hypothetical protein